MSTEQGIETVPIPATTDNTPMHAHIVCGACHPEATGDACPMGTPAICGEKVLGFKGRNADCPKCIRLRSAHRMFHMGGRG